MGLPLILGWTFIFMAVVSWKRWKANKGDPEREFWERENTANTTRKQDISNLDYVDFKGVTLPFALFADDFLQQCEEQVLKLKNEKILNLTGISNTDLKLNYGAANLPQLTQYDQNFTLLVRTLNSWGHRLEELGYPQEAMTVLAFSVSIGSDMKATYQLLAELYQQEGNLDGIRSMQENASRLNSLMKEPILSMLETMATGESARELPESCP